ncbi:hypothetical protein SASPL_136708 [Salvia splendens]|uniref:Uncharacterized protein n=1 Tax=Salvia splendens TaxID=180675 RepID=A0A8X8WYR0_SALSN|nr:hypothetical protein SASPL_136708 [Salvia splendens]
MNMSSAETSELNLIADEFESAFVDLLNDTKNNGRLTDFVDKYHLNSLNAPKFCSELYVNDPFFFLNFFVYIRRLCAEHSTVMETVEAMDDAFNKHLFWLGVLKKALSVFSNTSAAICVAAAICAANDVPKRVPEAAAAAAVSFLIPALARWGHSVLKKHKTTVKKNMKITDLMIKSTGLGIKHLARICELKSAAGTDEEEVPAVKASFEELLAKVEDYSSEMKWIKEEVKKSIIKIH